MGDSRPVRQWKTIYKTSPCPKATTKALPRRGLLSAAPLAAATDDLVSEDVGDASRLLRRNLCPRCPAGSQPISVKAAQAKGISPNMAAMCCRPRKTIKSTKTVTLPCVGISAGEKERGASPFDRSPERDEDLLSSGHNFCADRSALIPPLIRSSQNCARWTASNVRWACLVSFSLRRRWVVCPVSDLPQ